MSLSLVVGAGGFVGRHLFAELERRGDDVRPVTSRPGRPSWHDLRLLEPDPARIEAALANVARVYFVAGVAHDAVAVAGSAEVMHEVNVAAPERWLRAADRAGVGHFIWLSSIKVLGDVSGAPLTPNAPYRPGDAYAASKVEAERRLLGCPLSATALAVVRPPLVYGPEVRGNFARLLRWADSPLPLPLAGAVAPRSLVAVRNLCDLLRCIGDRHVDRRGIYHVADTADVNVSALVGELRSLFMRPSRQFYVAPRWLRTLARLARREALYQRLFEPLQVDTSATRENLDWTPPQTTADALLETVTWFRTSR